MFPEPPDLELGSRWDSEAREECRVEVMLSSCLCSSVISRHGRVTRVSEQPGLLHRDRDEDQE